MKRAKQRRKKSAANVAAAPPNPAGRVDILITRLFDRTVDTLAAAAPECRPFYELARPAVERFASRFTPEAA